MLFQQTAFYRSPNTDVNCKDIDCIKEREYKNYTWIEMAKPICVDYVGGNECYFNILGDNLGQGYHQYIFADSIYSSQEK